MTKLALFASTAAIVASLVLATLAPGAANADDDKCKRTDFKTEMVKTACQTSQKQAKAVMQKFNKDHKIKSCNQCHTKLAPNYELKADGLKQFTDLGGK